MYVPSAFRVEDAAKLTALIRQNSFATLVTHDGKSSFASHLPILYDPDAGANGTLLSHMARANPQWQHFANGAEALVIFQGPHAYISPSWYLTHPAVPTWNYAAVHAYGIPHLVNDHDRVVKLLADTITANESGRSTPWSADQLPAEYRDGMIKALVAFEIPLTRLEGKFKLSQNRSLTDVTAVGKTLSESADSTVTALAAMMLAESQESKVLT